MYEWFADRYGWTQRETDEGNAAWLLERLPVVAAVRAEVDEERRKREQKK